MTVLVNQIITFLSKIVPNDFGKKYEKNLHFILNVQPKI